MIVGVSVVGGGLVTGGGAIVTTGDGVRVGTNTGCVTVAVTGRGVLRAGIEPTVPSEATLGARVTRMITDEEKLSVVPSACPFVPLARPSVKARAKPATPTATP